MAGSATALLPDRQLVPAAGSGESVSIPESFRHGQSTHAKPQVLATEPESLVRDSGEELSAGATGARNLRKARPARGGREGTGGCGPGRSAWVRCARAR